MGKMSLSDFGSMLKIQIYKKIIDNYFKVI